MNVSVPSVLLGLVGKCLLNWSLVFLQRSHICRSFLGVFSVSLAVVDTFLTLSVTALHVHADGQVVLLGLRLTRYHVCLLVQIMGQGYSALQWPVVVVAGVDHVLTASGRSMDTRSRRIICVFVSSLLWSLTALYVLLLSGFRPVMEDVSYNQIHQCWIPHTPEILQVFLFLLLTLSCAVLHARLLKKDQITSIVHQTLRIFLNTWALFLVFLALLLLVPVGIPAYLGLNVAWLCFLNSLLTAVVLCAVCPASQAAPGLAAVPPDSFCEWTFKFSLSTEHERTKGKK